MPHHGKYEKILPEFFSLVGAQSAVITSSEKNPEEQETIQALEDAGVKDILLTRGGEVTHKCSSAGNWTLRRNNLANRRFFVLTGRAWHVIMVR